MDLFSKTEIIVMISVLGSVLLILIILTIIDMIDAKRNDKILELSDEKIEKIEDVVVSSTDSATVSYEVACNTISSEDINNSPDIEEIEILDFDDDLLAIKEEQPIVIMPTLNTNESVHISEEPIYGEIEPVEKPLNEQEKAKAILQELEKNLANDENFENTITNFEVEQEENAIISYDELIKISDKLYDQNEIIQYDDGDEPITIDEVIKRFSNNDMVFENTANYEKLDKAVSSTEQKLIELYKNE